MNTLFPPINLLKWIEDHRHLLKPPVGNKQIWENQDFMIFVVGGPNARKDYHINAGAEFFYQLEGEIVLKVVQNDQFQDITIGPGEIFLLPGGVPHSPQRGTDTIGLVIEHKRLQSEEDSLRWYCEGCGEILHESSFQLTDIVGQLKTAIQSFWADDALRTCKNCSQYLEEHSS